MEGGSAGGLPPLPLLAPLALYLVFFAGLFLHVAPNASMFVKRYARRHRMCGLIYLMWLLMGLVELSLSLLTVHGCWRGSGLQAGPSEDAPNTMTDHGDGLSSSSQDWYHDSHQIQPWRCNYCYLGYDIILGILGVTLKLTAAFDFASHGRIRNPASGALDEAATVSEMIEHSFYQLLNLCQILFVHYLGAPGSSLASRLWALAWVTLPWGTRAWFPVNSFSKNYISQPHTLTRVLYRLKKYQYLLYKHFLLHGLNLTITLLPDPSPNHPLSPLATRPYWLSLNAAYVLEFFLQTLVKKGAMRQGTMLALNQLLMLITTAPALQVLTMDVGWCLGLASLWLNLVNRGREVENIFSLTITTLTLSQLAPHIHGRV